MEILDVLSTKDNEFKHLVRRGHHYTWTLGFFTSFLIVTFSHHPSSHFACSSSLLHLLHLLLLPPLNPANLIRLKPLPLTTRISNINISNMSITKVGVGALGKPQAEEAVEAAIVRITAIVTENIMNANLATTSRMSHLRLDLMGSPFIVARALVTT